MNDNLEPKVVEEHCYNFEAVVTAIKKGYVFAKSKEEALELIKNCQWDEAYNIADSIEVSDVPTLLEDKLVYKTKE